MESSITQASNASETHNTPTANVDRKFVWGVILGGTAVGLPIPMNTGIHVHRHLVLRLDDNDLDAAARWAAYLGLPAPASEGHVHDLDGKSPWVSHGTGLVFTDRLPGWYATAWCVADPTTDELIAARDAAMTSMLNQAEQILTAVAK